jgi:hypothetical protein
MGKLGVIARHTQRTGGWVGEGINLFGFIDFNVQYGDITINTHVVVVNKVQPKYIIPNISNGIEETY